MVTETQEPVLLGGYAAKQCPVRVQNDFLPLVPTLEWVPSPEDQARLDAGIAFERNVFEELTALHPTAVVVDPQLRKADAIAMTVQAMDAGAPLVLGGWLPDDVDGGRTGRPDILIKAGRGYLPADVKNHLTLKPSEDHERRHIVPRVTRRAAARCMGGRRRPRTAMRTAYSWPTTRACFRPVATTPDPSSCGARCWAPANSR